MKCIANLHHNKLQLTFFFNFKICDLVRKKKLSMDHLERSKKPYDLYSYDRKVLVTKKIDWCDVCFRKMTLVCYFVNWEWGFH